MILELFVQWHIQIQDEIKDVLTLLGTKLDKEPEGLINDMMVIETWNGRMGELLAEANGMLDQARSEMAPPKDSGTELTRKLALDGSVSAIRVVRDKLESLCDCIKQRLIMSESILRYHTQFPDRKASEFLRPF